MVKELRSVIILVIKQIGRPRRPNRPFPSSKKFHFQSEANCEAIDMEIIFNYDANKTHFHNKGFARSLVLKVKLFGTRKWPIRHHQKLIRCLTLHGFLTTLSLLPLLVSHYKHNFHVGANLRAVSGPPCIKGPVTLNLY